MVAVVGPPTTMLLLTQPVTVVRAVVLPVEPNLLAVARRAQEDTVAAPEAPVPQDRVTMVHGEFMPGTRAVAVVQVVPG